MNWGAIISVALGVLSAAGGVLGVILAFRDKVKDNSRISKNNAARLDKLEDANDTGEQWRSQASKKLEVIKKAQDPDSPIARYWPNSK